MMFKNSEVACAGVLVVALVGCGPPRQTVAAETPAPPNPFDAIFSTAPSDPETAITLTAVGSDGHGGKTITRQTTTKGQMWIAAQAIAQGRSVTGNVETVRAAAVEEACWHGSNVVFNDGTAFGGTDYLCFRDDGVQDGDNSEPVNDLASYGFTARSYYTIVPTCLWNGSRTLRDAWALYKYHERDDIFGGASPTRYLQTPGNDMDIECPDSPPN